MDMSKEIGDIYETMVSQRLRMNGWSIIAKKYIGGGGEIDLIVLRNGDLCFVEVKGRKDQKNGESSIFSSMSKKKQKALISCSADFLEKYEEHIEFDSCYFVLCGLVGQRFFWIENPFDEE